MNTIISRSFPAVLSLVLMTLGMPAAYAQVYDPAVYPVVQRTLGHGYDATRDYAHERSLKSPIFHIPEDFATLRFTRMTGTTEIETRTEESATQFSKMLSASVQGGVNSGLFSASIAAALSKSDSSAQKTIFSMVDDRLTLFRVSLRGAQPYPEVLNELETLPVDKVIREYGTHYTNLIEYGGHLVFTTTMEESEKAGNTNANIEARAAYSIASGQAAAGMSSSDLSKKMAARGSFFATGGSAAINASGQDNAWVYPAWKQSIPGNPGIASFGDDGNGLIGLWEVPGLTAGRKAELEAAIKKYIADKAAGVFDKPGKNAKPDVPVVMKNSQFVLKGQDGTWLGGWASKSDGYYLNTVNSGAVMHRFTTNGDVLKGGEVVQIQTTQGGQASGWGDYSYICVGSTHTLYYYPGSGDYTNWRVWKGNRGQGGGEVIYFGDTISIESVSHGGQVMQPTYSPYLTTKPDEYKWTILQNP